MVFKEVANARRETDRYILKQLRDTAKLKGMILCENDQRFGFTKSLHVMSRLLTRPLDLSF